MYALKSVGECPRCGDDLILYRTQNRKRLVKCDNPECGLIYGIPKAGKIEATFEKCPETHLPILFIQKKNSDHFYFWTDGPCFNCRKGNSCKPLMELREEYGA
ncbi:MAG: hypothetical protein ACTSU2_13065 [Promethearchaeota archaeon]